MVTLSALGLAVGAPNLHEPGHYSKDFFFVLRKQSDGAGYSGAAAFKHKCDV
jgi:hypothetical protein